MVTLRTHLIKKINQLQKTESFSTKNTKQIRSLKNSFGGLGGMLAGAGIGIGFSQMVSAAGDFENGMARVRAITGATGKDFQMLKKNTAMI